MLKGLQQAQAYSDMLGFTADKKEYEMIDPSELIEIENQPFKPYTQERLEILAEDIELRGQDVPCKVRRMAHGELVILAGRNRKRACELKGLKVKCEIKEYTDEEADLILVNTNLLQRQDLSISEKVRAYALQKKSYEKLNITLKTLSSDLGEGVANIKRYVRLDILDDDYLYMIDDNQIHMMAGYELTFLTSQNRDLVKDFVQVNNLKLNKNQARLIRDLENSKPEIEMCDLEELILIKKETECKNLKLSYDEIKQYIPQGVDTKKYILELLQKAHGEPMERM